MLGLVHSPGHGTAGAAEAGALRSVRLIGEQTLPHRLDFQGTTVGGLSSIDYDPRTGEYVLISDDRSQLQSARFYTARLDVGTHELGEVRLTGTHTFTGADGAAYPAGSVDPEELRVDPFSGRYYWSQEGERTTDVLLDPSVREARRDGRYVRDLPIPDNSRMTEDAGPRRNLGPEGLTFAASGALVTSAMEGPLLQDGPEADTTRGALSRITVQGRRGPVLAQYAYPMEPVFAEPVPADGFATTGVSSILAENALDPTRYLVMERSFVEGVGNRIRIYRIDTSGGTNVRHADSLGDVDRLRPVRKRLLLDLADLGLTTVDNVEGMTWGPRLPTGERTLLLVSDDNFSPSQVTQFVALALR
ncbi:Uncharacterized conserved protein [Amycolatopsis marina]|uniref:Uncharacterized conserved protein n=1 Tax=Amycolatopsis marina TaxID=490629 RepID=A0A1I0VWQ4_9PSEU|nr:Uncharacterized conserved protein [Amycolatopsis marina]